MTVTIDTEIKLAKDLKRDDLDGKYPFPSILQCEVTRAEEFMAVIYPDSPPGSDTFPGGLNSKEHLVNLMCRAIPAFGIDRAVFMADGFGWSPPAEVSDDEVIAIRERIKTEFDGQLVNVWNACMAKDLYVTESMMIWVGTRNETVATFCDITMVSIPYEIYGRKYPKKIEWKDPIIRPDPLGSIRDAMVHGFSHQETVTWAFSDAPLDDPFLAFLRESMREHAKTMADEQIRFHADVASVSMLMKVGALIALGTNQDEEYRDAFQQSLERWGLDSQRIDK